MKKLFLALEQEGELAKAIALLKTLDSQQYVVSSTVGKVTRDILIYLVVGDVDIVNDYFQRLLPTITSRQSRFRTPRTIGDAEGQGPGVVELPGIHGITRSSLSSSADTTAGTVAPASEKRARPSHLQTT